MSELETIFQEDIYSIPAPLLIVIAKPWDELSEVELDTLSKMLKAVKLNLAAAQIIIKKEFDMNDLSVFAPTRVLAFGVSLTTPFKHYENINSGGVSIIISESLDQLDDQKRKVFGLPSGLCLAFELLKTRILPIIGVILYLRHLKTVWLWSSGFLT